ncbi:putative Glycosyltransferase family 92 [Rosa chinensis]|uniref:Glycosyltransferase family 92 protein n=1 Tax=Rosa chinensis TaxID=74649 RepID=A0A2P6Q7M1_ROSCH|nr:galactan beta-1,4-galactosyltransferase GALS3 [Rosa chinensis]PRQ30183.1 putative Glycosyltransferase family 92 [Rosa chinensis]
MAKEKQKEEKKLYVGIAWNYTAELKLLLTALLILCTLATLLQFIPSRFTISTSDLRVCISRVLTPAQPQQAQPPAQQQDSIVTNVDISAAAAASPPPLPPPPPPPPPPPTEEVLSNGIIKRVFNPHGAAAYSFINMGTYRGGMNTFAIVGLASKPLHVYSNPTYECQWIPTVNSSATVSAVGYKILPDWGYGRVYTVVVVNCTFSQPVNSDNSGGKLVLLASTGGGGDRNLNVTDEIEALTENPGSLNPSIFTSKPKYDYFYCGSSLYGNLSPQRVREWIAYHVRLFGPRSHFVIHDAGGIHEEVLEVLKPWMELGYVTLHDIRDQERFDGYYHNQFMVVNDCLHRYKFMAKWMFFFDVDEYIYMPPKSTLKTVLDSLAEYSQFTIEQMPMSNKLCRIEDYHKTHRKWGFEKLVFKDVKTGIRRDRKYAVRPRNVYGTGVHMSQNLAGKTTHKTENRIKYFHYHGTIADRREPCKKLINDTQIYLDKVPYVMDTTMRDVAGAVKRFEQRMIGSRLQQTRQ